MKATALLLAIYYTLASFSIAESDLARELKQAQEQHQKALASATEPVNRKYRDILLQLQRRATSANDLETATKIKATLDGLADSSARFSGNWLITFPNNSNRVYQIEADGSVAYTQERGEPMNKKCKIKKNGIDYLVDFGDGYVHRLSRIGDNLLVEHYNPGSLYPSSAPNLKGTGNLQLAKQ